MNRTLIQLSYGVDYFDAVLMPIFILILPE